MKTLFPTLAAVSVLLTPALAMGQSVAELDANGDGVLSLQEVQAVYPDTTEADFGTMDINGDGVLDDAEVQAAQDAGLMGAAD